MILQAFVDDSGSEPQSFAFILAGFVARPLQWATFTVEWERTLHRPPRLEYFKNNESMGLKDQFDRQSLIFHRILLNRRLSSGGIPNLGRCKLPIYMQAN